MQPAVSIVIPTYNHARFLEGALQSVFSQTYSHWEVIIINNFSEDETIQIVQKFNDPRIRLINFRNHGVIASSRNEGIRLARADLIAFLDSDDKWYPNKLEKCINAFTSDIDCICHSLVCIRNEKPWRYLRAGSPRKAHYKKLLYGQGYVFSPTALIAKKQSLLKVGNFSQDAKIATAEDYDFWLKMAREGIRFHFIDDVLGEHFIHSTNASNAVLQHFEACLAVIQKHFSERGRTGLWENLLMQRKKALLVYGAARSFQHNNKRREAPRYFLKSLRLFPLLPRAYLGLLLNLLPHIER